MKALGILVIGLLSVLLLVGCQRATTPLEPTTAKSVAPPLGKLSLPEGTVVTSAMLSLYQQGTYGTVDTIRIYRVTADWSEMVVTWNLFNEQYAPNVIASFPATPGLHQVDITGLVQDWVNGSYPIYGLALRQPDVVVGYSWYGSSEYFFDINQRPKLVLKYMEGGVEKTVIFQRGGAGTENIVDAWIYEYEPDINRGSYPSLLVGMVGVNEKIVLINFSLESHEGGGCTLTPGYWKTHSQEGPAPYDETWKQIGVAEEDTPFFLSGQSYYEVFWTSTNGNAYYILAHQYIAAQLNQKAGASIPTPVLDAFNTATTLFSTVGNTPANIGGLKGSNTLRQQFLSLATILDNYNNGLIGPGHCE